MRGCVRCTHSYASVSSTVLSVFNCREMDMERSGRALTDDRCDPTEDCCGLGEPVYRHVASQYHYICTADTNVDPDYPNLRIFGIIATIMYVRCCRALLALAP